jgi:hypothetical protein
MKIYPAPWSPVDYATVVPQARRYRRPPHPWLFDGLVAGTLTLATFFAAVALLIGG